MSTLYDQVSAAATSLASGAIHDNSVSVLYEALNKVSNYGPTVGNGLNFDSSVLKPEYSSVHIGDSYARVYNLKMDVHDSLSIAQYSKWGYVYRHGSTPW